MVGAINKLSTLSGNWMQIFRNFFIPCNGHIREWRLFAGVTGVINFGVWRKVPNEEKMMLVGKNKITVTSLNMSVRDSLIVICIVFLLVYATVIMF